MSKINLTSEVKVRLTDDEKKRLKQLADEAEISMSDLIRSVLFIDKKLVFLVEGSVIAQSLFDIRKSLEILRREDVIPAREIEKLQVQIHNVDTQLYALSERLSNIHAESGEEGEDADA